MSSLQCLFPYRDKLDYRSVVFLIFLHLMDWVSFCIWLTLKLGAFLTCAVKCKFFQLYGSISLVAYLRTSVYIYVYFPSIVKSDMHRLTFHCWSRRGTRAIKAPV